MKDRLFRKCMITVVGADTIRPAGNCTDPHWVPANTVTGAARAVNNRPYIYNHICAVSASIKNLPNRVVGEVGVI